MTSPTTGNERPVRRHHAGGITWSTATNVAAAAFAGKSQPTSGDVDATSDSTKTVAADGSGNKPEVDSVAASTVGKMLETKLDCRHVLFDVEQQQPVDCRVIPVADDTQKAEITTASASADHFTDDTAAVQATGSDDSLRTCRPLIFPSSFGATADTMTSSSFKMTDAESKMHAALAAAGGGQEFGLSPPRCVDVNSSSSDVHAMIENELIQTLRLL